MGRVDFLSVFWAPFTWRCVIALPFWGVIFLAACCDSQSNNSSKLRESPFSPTFYHFPLVEKKTQTDGPFGAAASGSLWLAGGSSQESRWAAWEAARWKRAN